MVILPCLVSCEVFGGDQPADVSHRVEQLSSFGREGVVVTA